MTKYGVTDLPEPLRTALSSEERTYRQWRLLSNFSQFVAFYACIHKIFIPLVLKFTSLVQTPYSHIQYSVLLPVVFSFSVFASTENNSWISLLSGAGLVFGIDEVYQTFIGRHQGWFAFSRLLSSIPFAFCCGVAMSRQSFKGRMSFAWIGAFSLLAFISARELKLSGTRGTDLLKNEVNVTRELIEESAACGAMQAHISPETNALSSKVIRIANCGLHPSLIELKDKVFQLKNETSESTNFHLIYFDGNRKVSGWNVLLPPQTSVFSPPVQLKGNRVGVLYSDSNPKAGLTVFVNEPFRGNFKVTRKPLEGFFDEKNP